MIIATHGTYGSCKGGGELVSLKGKDRILGIEHFTLHAILGILGVRTAREKTECSYLVGAAYSFPGCPDSLNNHTETILFESLHIAS